jgi:hypothetical protein
MAVNAWLDRDGTAHGTVTYEGDVFQPLPGGQTGFRGGPSGAWHMVVTDLYFIGNTAWVSVTVVDAPNKQDVGIQTQETFTDNSGTGEPDQIDGAPIDAGRISIR